MSKFEFAKGWENCGTNLPIRKTTGAAGYDFEVAEDGEKPQVVNADDSFMQIPDGLEGELPF